MKPIRWGIIGCGDVTEVKSGPGFRKAQGSELVAVMRRDAAKAEDYARRHGVPRWYADADQLIADAGVDAVYVATPPGTHEFYAHKVLAAGKPCYMEKPMSRNAAEAQRMVRAFAQKNTPLFVAYYRRAMPRFQLVKAMIDGNALGRIRNVRYCFADGQHLRRIDPVPWRFQPEHSGSGLFLDLASHALDMLDFWLGPLTLLESDVRNTSGTYAVEDFVRATLTAPGAERVTIELDHNSVPMDEFHVIGDNGEVRATCFGKAQVHFTDRFGRGSTFDIPNPPHIAQPMIQTVVNDLQGTGTCLSPGTSALRTQEIIDQILTGYYGGREDGFWARPWPGNRRA
jgi:predicted dehydrogenase